MKIAIINLITISTDTPKGLLSVIGLTPMRKLDTDKNVMIVELGRSLAEQGHEVTIYISDVYEPKNKVVINGVSIVYLRTFMKRLFPASILPFTPDLLLSELRKNKFDVIQTTDMLQWGTIFASLATIFSKTKIAVWQGLDETKSPIWMFTNKTYNYTIGRIIQKKISIYFTKSNLSLKFLTKSGIPSNKIYGLIPVGVNISLFHPIDGSITRQNLSIGPNVPLILTVARLHSNKGLNYLIDSMALVVRKEPKTVLIIQGNGPLKNNLEKQIGNLGLEKNIHIFSSSIPREDMASMYAACDFTVLPSITEPFGFVVIESMACGKPVIASNIGGPKDILNDGKSGLLVEPCNSKELAEKMLFMIQNPSVRQKMGKVALQIVREKYEWGSVAKQISSIYAIL